MTFEIADSGKLIQSDLKVLKESINEKERELKLSKAIDAKISELVTVENCKITEEELKETHRDKAGNGTMQNPSAVEPAIRQLKFNKMYEDFQEEIFNIAAEEHESNFKEIVEIFKTRFGLSDRNACSDALIENICEFIDGRSTKDSADGQGKAYFSSLIERFARDIYEILILKTRGQDRYNQFRDRVENYLSMGVFYSAKKARLAEGDQFSYIDAMLSDSPMWKLLLWPELLDDCEKVDTNRVWETLKNLTGISQGDSISIDRFIGTLINRYGKHFIEFVTKVFTGFAKSRPEMELVEAAKEILRGYIRGEDEEGKAENEDLRDIIYDTNEVTLANIFEQYFDIKEILFMFKVIKKEKSSEIFAYLPQNMKQQVINGLQDHEIKVMLDNMFTDDISEFLEELPANIVKRVLNSASNQRRSEINMILNFKENSAGSVMSTDYVELDPEITADEALKMIKDKERLAETISYCYITNNQHILLGFVSMRSILLASSNTLISDIMETDVISVECDEDQEQVAKIFSKYDLLVLPVVNDQHRLIGIITIDDVYDIIQDEDLLQYDKLPIVLEDIFLLNSKGEDENV